MKTLKITTTILLLFAWAAFKGEEKEKFIGEKNLRSCQAEIPLYYSTKRKEALVNAAKEFENIEIVLVTNEKKGLASYKYYYLESYEGTYGPSAFLVSPADHKSKSKTKTAFFLGYKPKKHTFYRADCFREKLEEITKLNETLKEKK